MPTGSPRTGSIPQCWVSVQEQLPQSSNDPGILSEPVSVSAKHLDVFQQEHTGLVLLGLGEGRLYFLLCGCTGVTAQTDAIDLPDTPHHTTPHSCNMDSRGAQDNIPQSFPQAIHSSEETKLGISQRHISGRIKNRHIQDALAWINGCLLLLCKR